MSVWNGLFFVSPLLVYVRWFFPLVYPVVNHKLCNLPVLPVPLEPHPPSGMFQERLQRISQDPGVPLPVLFSFGIPLIVMPWATPCVTPIGCLFCSTLWPTSLYKLLHLRFRVSLLRWHSGSWSPLAINPSLVHPEESPILHLFCTIAAALLYTLQEPRSCCSVRAGCGRQLG